MSCSTIPTSYLPHQFAEENPLKINFGTTKSVYNSNTLVPIINKRTFSFQPDMNIKEESGMKEEAYLDKVINYSSMEQEDIRIPRELDFHAMKLEEFDYEAPGTPTLYKEKNTITLLDSMNSFSGKKTHAERQRAKNQITFGTNNNTTSSNESFVQNHFGAGVIDKDGKEVKKRMPCNCKKSKCLKLYCDCFAAGESCTKDCNCVGCYNDEEHEKDRQQAIDIIRERNPTAFKKKVDIQSPTKIVKKTKLKSHCFLNVF